MDIHLTTWITTKCRKFLRDGNASPLYQSPEKPVYRSRSNSQNQAWNNGLVQKLRKEYGKAVYCHSIYLSYMQNTSCKMPDWMNHKLESRLLGEISTASDMQIISL